MEELVSVIVPVYNAEVYLRKCIESIINQTYEKLEVILVDDGSTDNSGKICDEYSLKDNRIRVIHKSNKGLSDTRNKGIEIAQGEYLSFVDSDDYIDRDMIRYIVENMEQNKCDIGICGWFLEREKDISICKFECSKMIINSEKCIEYLLSNNSFDNFMCNKIFKKKLFKNIRFPVGKKLEDLSVLYKIISEAESIYIESKPLYYYVLHDNSITSNLYNQIDESVFDEYIIRKDNLLKMYPNLKDKILSNYFTACRSNLIISIKSNKRDAGFEKERIKDMKENWKYIWKDKSIKLRSKISFTLSTINPYLFFKLRFREELNGKRVKS